MLDDTSPKLSFSFFLLFVVFKLSTPNQCFWARDSMSVAEVPWAVTPWTLSYVTLNQEAFFKSIKHSVGSECIDRNSYFINI